MRSLLDRLFPRRAFLRRAFGAGAATFATTFTRRNIAAAPPGPAADTDPDYLHVEIIPLAGIGGGRP